jgi:sensor domain CHASE-containing protein
MAYSLLLLLLMMTMVMVMTILNMTARSFLRKQTRRTIFLLQSVENVTLTARIRLLKCESFGTENGTK